MFIQKVELIGIVHLVSIVASLCSLFSFYYFSDFINKLAVTFQTNSTYNDCLFCFVVFQLPQAQKVNYFQSNLNHSKKSPTLHVSTVLWIWYSGNQWNGSPCQCSTEMEQQVTQLTSKPCIVSSWTTCWELQFKHNVTANWTKWTSSDLLLEHNRGAILSVIGK